MNCLTICMANLAVVFCYCCITCDRNSCGCHKIEDEAPSNVKPWKVEPYNGNPKF